MPNKTSQHILPTSSNLLGFCLIVITSLHVSGRTTSSILDEVASIVGLLLCISVMLSFISLRAESIKLTRIFELVAEVLFGIAVVGIAIILLILLNKFWLK